MMPLQTYALGATTNYNDERTEAESSVRCPVCHNWHVIRSKVVRNEYGVEVLRDSVAMGTRCTHPVEFFETTRWFIFQFTDEQRKRIEDDKHRKAGHEVAPRKAHSGHNLSLVRR